MTRVRIRKPEPGEVPLSLEEEWVAVRDGARPAESVETAPTWHPEILRNWSVMTARLHRAAAVQRLTEE